MSFSFRSQGIDVGEKRPEGILYGGIAGRCVITRVFFSLGEEKRAKSNSCKLS